MALFKLNEEKVNESIETGAYNIASSTIFGHHVLNAKRWVGLYKLLLIH